MTMIHKHMVISNSQDEIGLIQPNINVIELDKQMCLQLSYKIQLFLLFRNINREVFLAIVKIHSFQYKCNRRLKPNFLHYLFPL